MFKVNNKDATADWMMKKVMFSLRRNNLSVNKKKKRGEDLRIKNYL